MNLEDPIAVALLAAEALDRQGLRHALYGALALAAYGEARQTRDADFCVLDVNAPQAAAALRASGVDLLIAFEDLLLGGLKVSRLTLLPGPEHSGSNTVDLVSPITPDFCESVHRRSLRGPLRGREVRLVSPEDFILLKILSTRDRDLSDAASVLRRLDARLDWPLLLSQAAALAIAVPGHDVAGRFTESRAMANHPALL